jgi:predicted cobalt transporter CbtA
MGRTGTSGVAPDKARPDHDMSLEEASGTTNPPRRPALPRSVSVFMITFLATGFALVPTILAFGVTEILARRFPDLVRLRWVFRPTLLALASFGSLFLLSVFFTRNVAAICIEGGEVLGFPWPFFEQCLSPGGRPDPPQFILGALLLDLLIWYILGTILAALVRPQRRVRGFIA